MFTARLKRTQWLLNKNSEEIFWQVISLPVEKSGGSRVFGILIEAYGAEFAESSSIRGRGFHII